MKILIVVLLWSGSHAVERTQVGQKMEIKGANSQLGWILGLYRVILLIVMRICMLIFISKLTEITKIPDIRENSGKS